MKDIRRKRIESEIQRQLGNIIARMNDEHIKHITITEIIVTPDGRYATVYYTYSEGVQIKQKAVENAAGYLRSKLAKAMKLRYTPALTFKKDSGYVKERSMDELFGQLDDEENN